MSNDVWNRVSSLHFLLEALIYDTFVLLIWFRSSLVGSVFQVCCIIGGLITRRRDWNRRPDRIKGGITLLFWLIDLLRQQKKVASAPTVAEKKQISWLNLSWGIVIFTTSSAGDRRKLEYHGDRDLGRDKKQIFWRNARCQVEAARALIVEILIFSFNWWLYRVYILRSRIDERLISGPFETCLGFLWFRLMPVIRSI